MSDSEIDKHVGEDFCGTCQTWWDWSVVGQIPCTVCHIKECSRHSGTTWTCRLCRRENLCLSCAGNHACCEMKESIADETRALKMEIEQLTTENKKLRQALEAISLSIGVSIKLLANPKSP